jgi:hypothetical protein
MKDHFFKQCFCIIVIAGFSCIQNCSRPFYVEEGSRLYAIQEENYLPYRQKHTVEGYKEYIARYPGSAFISEAEMWIDAIQFAPYEKLDTVEGYKEFKEKYPENRHVYRADAYLGRIEAKRYEKMDTLEGYREFLEKYPDNNFAGLAKKRLQELEFKKLDLVLQEKYGFDLLRYRLALRRLKKQLSEEDVKRGEVNIGDFDCFASFVTYHGKKYFHTHLIYPLKPYYSEATPKEGIERFFDPLISKALVYLDSHFMDKDAIDGFSFDVSTSADYFYGDRVIHLAYYFPTNQVKRFVTNKINKKDLLAHSTIVTPGQLLR